MNKYDEKAKKLQDAVWISEVDKASRGDSYDDDLARMATVHARGDIVLLVSYLSSVNQQLATIRRLIWFVAAVALYEAAR